ncbi:MAG TPA: Gldg family protein [Verrucomicrobiae bacterium]|nr:Gldg family protein [Verrucomicrobiae bacterium]
MNANANPALKSNLPSLALVILVFAAGIALAGIWLHTHPPRSATNPLSGSTRAVLGQLTTPVTIRYYALLPAGSADETLQSFAGRVAQLLNAMQTASGGKIQLANLDTPAKANANAASADGIQPFNLDKGEACFLGLAIASGNDREAFARLQPEWEPALEFDLARAIQRVAATAAPASPAPEIAKPNPKIIATINRLIPDVTAVSVEQADQIFHAEFLKRCNEVNLEVETLIKPARQKVVEAQTSGSPEDLEAARKNLLAVQLAQAEKVKALNADLQTQLAVFQKMKADATNDAK